MAKTIKTDDNHRVIPVSGSFTTEEVELTGTAFTDNDVDVDGAMEMTLISAASFTIAEASDGDGYPVAADTPFQIGVANMTKIWLKGANEQDVFVIRHFL